MIKIDFAKALPYYQQEFFTFDKPIPFLPGLFVHPVTIENYYSFYSSVHLLTKDKNADIENMGVKKTHLGYLLHLFEYADEDKVLLNQFLSLISLTFNIKNTIICDSPTCSKEEIEPDHFRMQALSLRMQGANLEDGTVEKQDWDKQVKDLYHCDVCGSPYREKIAIKLSESAQKEVYIGHQKLTDENFDFYRRLVCYQNILDFEDDYIDPVLKEELDRIAKLKNPNKVPPTLEKQMAAIVAHKTGYTFETLRTLSMRKFTMLLRICDELLHYMACKNGEMSGMVTFKNEIQHYLYDGNGPKDRYADFLDYETFKSSKGLG